MISEDEVRRRTESLLGGPLSEREWGFLVKRDYITEVMLGVSSVDTLVEEVREHRRSFGQSSAGRPDAPQMLDEERRRNGKVLDARQHALSLLFAHHANLYPGLVLHRRGYLPDGLLPWSEVEGWIQQKSRVNAPPTRWCEVPIPDGVMRLEHDEAGRRYTYDRPFADALENPVQMGWKLHLLDYGVPDDPYERSIPTHAGGILESLRRLSEQLCTQFAWVPSQATIFILTGIPPLVETISAHTRLQYPMSAASRMTLTIDPALSPREVADYYRMIRRSAFGGARHRPQTEKHLQLALFSALRTDDETWAEQMAEWNKEHPDWRYTEPTNFARDCTAAQRRLLHPNWG